MQVDYIASGESNGLFVKFYRGEDMVLLASILTYLYAHRISSALASSILSATRRDRTTCTISSPLNVCVSPPRRQS